MRHRYSLPALTARLVCAWLIAFVGMVHQAPMVDAAPSNFARLYALPDGTVADLCIDLDSAAKPGKHKADHGCESCRIASGAALPFVDSLSDMPRPERNRIARISSEAFQRLLLPPTASPRGPPTVSHLA